MDTNNNYDVAILGTGIGGTILGAILAKQGLRVHLIEQGNHPRFAIGESTVPETTFFFRLLAERYGVPEIAYLSSYQLIRRHVSSNSGVKRNFSFVRHGRNQPQIPNEATQLPTFSPPFGPDLHMYRQDVDAYMLSVALSYGATAKVRTNITDVDFHADGVALTTSEGEKINARFFIDAGGVKSLLATKLGLRIEPCPFKTRSRSVFTHMAGVLPYDACHADRSEHGLPSPFSEGTLHHLFEGAWMWVIPFDNHPMSTNQFVSVGLNLDIDKYPKTNLPPEEEFKQFISQYPNVAKQFANATAIREWIATDRLQFTSSRMVGDRYAMLPHAFSFIDPLFSSGLSVTMAAINLLSDRIIKAAADDDFSSKRFEDVEMWVTRNFNTFDKLVSGAYTSFFHFELWNAWMRVWMIGSLYGAMGNMEMFQHAQRNKHAGPIKICDEYPYRAAQGNEYPQINALLTAASEQMDGVRNKTISPDDASARIFELVRASGLWPATWGEARPERRHPGALTLWSLAKLSFWVRFRSPEGIREFNFVSASFPKLMMFSFSDWFAELKNGWKSVKILSRDFIFFWNRDWDKKTKN